MKKLIGHSGIRFSEACQLEKKDFDFINKTILIRKEIRKTNVSRLATIRPDDAVWFELFLKDIEDKLFPFPKELIMKKMNDSGITSPHSLRSELSDELLTFMDKDSPLLRIKFGLFIDDTIDYDENFKKLQILEQRIWGR